MKRVSVLKHQGFLTIIMVVLIVVIGFIGVAIAYVFSATANSTANLQQGVQGLYLAESGLENATQQLRATTLASSGQASQRVSCASFNSSAITASVGPGTYLVTSTGPNYVSSPTTLNGALNSTAMTIPAASTTGYQSSGRIRIDMEEINYAAIDSTNFYVIQRGADGTTATTHVTGTPVAQNQCNLTSTGGAPSATPANSNIRGGLRKLNEAVELQDAWAMGDGSGTSIVNAHWNNPTELTWNASTVTASTTDSTIYSIAMISNVDGWAVGEDSTAIQKKKPKGSAVLFRWNGNAWTNVSSLVNYGVFNNKAYLSDITCSATNQCYAVGQDNNDGVVISWNGTAWSIAFDNVNKNGFNGIACPTTSNCWAVGNNNAGLNQFLQLSGGTWGLINVSVTAFPYNAVFCNSTSDCWAVGASNSFARYTGSWANYATGLTNGTYNDIYCNASNDCWTVGLNSGGTAGLIAHWNGSAWSNQTLSPTPSVSLNAVRCANTNDCWAAGDSDGTQPIFYHYDGIKWTQFTVSGLVNANINALSNIISPSTKPWSAWSESTS